MIIGLGSDLIDIRRIEKTMERFGDRFLARVFTDQEQAKALRRKNAGVRVAASTLAKRFAAKEACSKALGTGISQGVSWRDMEVVSLPTGQPVFRLTGGAAERLKGLTPPGMAVQVSVTMTDEYPYAQAIVIIATL